MFSKNIPKGVDFFFIIFHLIAAFWLQAPVILSNSTNRKNDF